MSQIRRDLYRRKLAKLLRIANDEDFFVMMWSIHAAQTGRAEHARNFLEFPDHVATNKIASKFSVYPWKCETLLNELLVTQKKTINGPFHKELNCKNFSAVAAVFNALTSLEGAEDNLTLKRVNVLNELHRLGQRQFEWQRGFLSIAQIYRSAFLYGGPKANKYLINNNGVSLNEISLAAFAFRTQLQTHPAINSTIDLMPLGISSVKKDAILNILSINHQDARKRTSNLRADERHTGYKKSLFREYPLISFGDQDERLHCPLPDLVFLRSTTGLFYDLINGGGEVRNEISSRFESYCLKLLQSMLTALNVRPSFKYRIKKGVVIDSPDILCNNKNGAINLIFECKARRLSFEARFSEDPVADARGAYDEMAKGVLQVWRFISDHRRGLIDHERVDPDVKGVVLTLDTWMSNSTALQSEVLALAMKGTEKYPDILPEDCIPVIFCPVDELEQTLDAANEKSFFEAVNASTRKEFEGWSLSRVHQVIAPDIRMNNEYPFENNLSEVLPWWGKVTE